MSGLAKRPDVDAVLSQLKDFQRQTVDHVFQRMFLDAEPAYRFLVADEVGLGAGLDGRSDVLHARIARGQLENGQHREHAVQNGDDAGANRQPQPRRGNHAELLSESGI